jgi:exonuclease III
VLLFSGVPPNDQRVFVAQMYDGANSGAEPDQVERSAICSAITALSEALASERQRVIRGEQEIAELRGELADARGAERISSDATAALRHQLDLLLARRPWWRRWFR